MFIQLTEMTRKKSNTPIPSRQYRTYTYQINALTLGLLLLLPVVTAILGLILLLFLLLLVVTTLGLLILALIRLFLVRLCLLILSQNVVAKLVVHVDHFLAAARHALVIDAAGLDLVVGLREAAVRTKDEDVDVTLDGGLEDAIGVSPVDHGPVGVGVVGGLSAELAAEELVDLARIAVEGKGDVGYVGNDGLDAVASTLDLAVDAGHLVAVLGIVDRRGAGDVDYCTLGWHFDCRLVDDSILGENNTIVINAKLDTLPVDYLL